MDILLYDINICNVAAYIFNVWVCSEVEVVSALVMCCLCLNLLSFVSVLTQLGVRQKVYLCEYGTILPKHVVGINKWKNFHSNNFM